MHIAILTFEGFNELDSLIALGILNRVRKPNWRVSIASPTARVRSMNGVVLEAQASLSEVTEADAVIVGSGMQTREVVADAALMAQLQLDSSRQLLGAQCSGTLVLAKLGLLDGVPACTDLITKPWVEEAGVAVLDKPFFARGNFATAARGARGCPACYALRSAGGRKGTIRLARDAKHHPILGWDVRRCLRLVECTLEFQADFRDAFQIFADPLDSGQSRWSAEGRPLLQ
jgi:transcriptional regulator GlxA family with amidase domain